MKSTLLNVKETQYCHFLLHMLFFWIWLLSELFGSISLWVLTHAFIFTIQAAQQWFHCFLFFCLGSFVTIVWAQCFLYSALLFKKSRASALWLRVCCCACVASMCQSDLFNQLHFRLKSFLFHEFATISDFPPQRWNKSLLPSSFFSSSTLVSFNTYLHLWPTVFKVPTFRRTPIQRVQISGRSVKPSNFISFTVGV